METPIGGGGKITFAEGVIKHALILIKTVGTKPPFYIGPNINPMKKSPLLRIVFAWFACALYATPMASQGWSISSYSNGGNPQAPYQGSIFNGITALTTFEDGWAFGFKIEPQQFLTTNITGIENSYASGTLGLPTQHIIVRDAIGLHKDTILAVQEHVPLPGMGRRSVHLVTYAKPNAGQNFTAIATATLFAPNTDAVPTGMTDNGDGTYLVYGHVTVGVFTNLKKPFVLKCTRNGQVLWLRNDYTFTSTPEPFSGGTISPSKIFKDGSGYLTIINKTQPSSSLTFTIDKDTVAVNGTTCLSVRTKGFVDMVAFQVAMTYDTTKLVVAPTVNIPLALTSELFVGIPPHPHSDQIRVLYTAPLSPSVIIPTTYLDSTELFSVCFTAKPNATGQAFVKFENGFLVPTLFVNAFEASTGPITGVTLNNGYVQIGSSGITPADQYTNPILIKLDGNGNLLSETLLGSSSGGDVINGFTKLSDGNFAYCGKNGLNGPAFVRKMDSNGNTIWQREYTVTGLQLQAIIEDNQGNIVASGTRENINLSSAAMLLKLDPTGLPLWERSYGHPTLKNAFTHLVMHKDGGYLAGGYFGTSSSYLVHTDVNGNIYPSGIRGQIAIDQDQNCDISTGDLPLANWIVKAYRDSVHTYYGTTDPDGNYLIGCDTGNYVVSIQPPNPFMQPCANMVPIHLGYLDTLALDFPISETNQCSYLSVDQSTNLLRPCNTLPLHIQYCNLGTADELNAYIEVTLDTQLIYASSTLPATVNGQIVTIPIGLIEEGACANLELWVAVSCWVQQGQTLCSTAEIFGDSTCTPTSPSWSGALIQADVQCEGDSIRFELENIGTQAMPVSQEYIIIEDAVLLRQGSYQLNPGGKMNVKVPANGSTFHMLANQVPNAPIGGQTVAAIEGCVATLGAPFSVGFINQFALSSSDPNISEFCIAVVTSFDPNDKRGFPTGFGNEHNIFANTDLEYMIRFQNTGTDTAFRVVLLDTLSPLLDAASIRPGASSHPYTYALSENGILKFTFPGIKLPHETVDTAGSNGFVTFRIKQQNDLKPGTELKNTAGIYFDYNDPVITNTTLHTIHAPFFTVSTQSPTETTNRMTMYPNPFGQQVTIRLENEAITEALLELYNAQGQLQISKPMVGNQVNLERGELIRGIYFFSIRTKDGVINSGKVIVE
jgi:Secretion system C-terminal sorting domain